MTCVSPSESSVASIRSIPRCRARSLPLPLPARYVPTLAPSRTGNEPTYFPAVKKCFAPDEPCRRLLISSSAGRTASARALPPASQ
jgi:hypothetical protein